MDNTKKYLLYMLASISILSLIGCTGESEEDILSVEEAEVLLFEQLSSEEQENTEIVFKKKIFNAYLFRVYTINGLYAYAHVKFNGEVEIDRRTIGECCATPPSRDIVTVEDAKIVLTEQLQAEEQAEYRVSFSYKTDCCYYFDVIKIVNGEEEKLPQQEICGPCNTVQPDEAKLLVYNKLTPEQQEEYTVEVIREELFYSIKVYKIVDGEESILRIYKLDYTTGVFELSEYNAELLVYQQLSKEHQEECIIELVFNTGKSYHYKVYKMVDGEEISIGKYAVNYKTEEIRKIE